MFVVITEGQSGGDGQAGTSTSFDAGEQSIIIIMKSHYYCQSSLQKSHLVHCLFILEGSEQKVESGISVDYGTSAGSRFQSCLDQGTLFRLTS